MRVVATRVFGAEDIAYLQKELPEVDFCFS